MKGPRESRAFDPSQRRGLEIVEADRMNAGIQTPATGMRASRGLVVFALLALSLVLARPICDAHWLLGSRSHSGPFAAADHAQDGASHNEDAGPCCASIEDGTLAVPATTVIPAVKSPAPALVATASLTGWREAAPSLAAAIVPGRPPDPQSYYARSARILI